MTRTVVALLAAVACLVAAFTVAAAGPDWSTPGVDRQHTSPSPFPPSSIPERAS